MSTAADGFHLDSIHLDIRIKVAVVLLRVGSTNGVHDSVSQDVRNQLLEDPQQRECSAIDAHVVVFPKCSGFLQRAVATSSPVGHIRLAKLSRCTDR